MTRHWMWSITVLFCFVALNFALPTSSVEDTKKMDQLVRPKQKRSQEMLMFGNQQNRQGETPNNPYTPLAEKRTLSSLGSSDLKEIPNEEEKYPRAQLSTGKISYDRKIASPYERNYEYGKVLGNELSEESAGLWDVPAPYPLYRTNEDRRKRSEKSTSTTTSPPTTTPVRVSIPTRQPTQTHSKRNVPIYTEPRYKRELNIDTEDLITLLSLWENQRRERNYRKYGSDDYDNEEEAGLMEDEDPRNGISWVDDSIYPVHRYSEEALPPSEIGIVRTHPPSYYEQYGNQYGDRYDNDYRYNAGQYEPPYSQHVYYPADKKYMVTRKRSQPIYDPYAQLRTSSQARGYPSYQRRLVY